MRSMPKRGSIPPNVRKRLPAIRNPIDSLRITTGRSSFNIGMGSPQRVERREDDFDISKHIIKKPSLKRKSKEGLPYSLIKEILENHRKDLELRIKELEEFAKEGIDVAKELKRLEDSLISLINNIENKGGCRNG